MEVGKTLIVSLKVQTLVPGFLHAWEWPHINDII